MDSYPITQMMTLSERSWILLKQRSSDWSEFTKFWKGMYDYSSKNTSYESYIINRPVPFTLNGDHVQELFRWKNNTGENLSVKKATSLEKNVINQIAVVQQLSILWDSELFNTHFNGISAVWQTFLMHIIQPEQFPIFDQHVYRSYTYLQTGRVEELRGNTKQKLALYESYRAFFDAVKQSAQVNPRDIDMALWAFGKFIKQYKI